MGEAVRVPRRKCGGECRIRMINIGKVAYKVIFRTTGWLFQCAAVFGGRHWADVDAKCHNYAFRMMGNNRSGLGFW
jgi:hypothetical protein